MSRLLEIIARSHSLPSLTAPTPRSTPVADRSDILGALGGIRDGVHDIGPELLAMEAGVSLMREEDAQRIVAGLAQDAFEDLQHDYDRHLAWPLGKAVPKPHMRVCEYAAQVTVAEWMGQKALRVEQHSKACRTKQERMGLALSACQRRLGAIRDAAMGRLDEEIRAVYGEDET